MCGILGLWFPSKVNENELNKVFSSMSNKLQHRGPDNFGFWGDNSFGIYLSHQRLSILDLSISGNQPMHSYSGRYVLTFNGEIYNHLELRKSLKVEKLISREWLGSSDTETILSCIEAYGVEEAVKKFVGMFAMAIWDRKLKTLFMVRDRFGEKPIYYGFLKKDYLINHNLLIDINEPILFFSSELAVLKEMPGINLEIDPISQAAFLNYGYLPEPLCIYKDIYKVSTNSIYAFKPGRDGYFHKKEPIKIKYWDYRNLVNQKKFTSKYDAINNLENGLARSIKSQSISDVPIGVFLSGGIDSSLITAIFQEQNKNPIKSFSIGFKESGLGEKFFDESTYSTKIAQYLGTEHTQIQLNSKDILDIIPNIQKIYSEPFADPSQLPTYLLSKITRNAGIKVALSGDGGDELFGGYNRHWVAPKIFNLLRYFPEELRNLLSSGIDKIFINNNGLNRDKFQKMLRAINASNSIELIYDSLLSQWPLYTEFSSLPYFEKPSFIASNSIYESLFLTDINFYLPSDILTKVDRASMSVSLETRAPFLDHRLAEIAFKIPVDMKIKSNFSRVTTKWILKKILEKKIPKELINRKKVGFAVPISKWLQGPLKSWANDLLTSDNLYEQNYLDRDKINKLWKEHLESKYDHSNRLWTILMWQSWKRT
tara:strand:+ start:1002 stop:2966 length:1965 start_codon:yes stop_codon:yes gene_type:complete